MNSRVVTVGECSNLGAWCTTNTLTKDSATKKISIIYFSFMMSIVIVSIYLEIKALILFKKVDKVSFKTFIDRYSVIRFLPIYIIISTFPSIINRLVNIFSGYETVSLNYITVLLEQTTGYLIFLITVMSNPINRVVLQYCKSIFKRIKSLCSKAPFPKAIQSYGRTAGISTPLMDSSYIKSPSG